MTNKSDTCCFENSASDLGSDLIHNGRPRRSVQHQFFYQIRLIKIATANHF